MSYVGKILITTVALLGTVVMQERLPQHRISDQITFEFNEGFATFSADSLRLMTFGYEKVISDMLWIRFLHHSPPKKMGANQVSWLYLDLDAISELDPDFLPVYELGGLFVSVITEDKRGAELILKKGAQRFPNRWKTQANLAYHYEFELNEPDKASPYYLAAAKLPGAPDIIKLIASTKLAKQKGNKAAADFLEKMLTENPNPIIKKKLNEKLEKYRKGAM